MDGITKFLILGLCLCIPQINANREILGLLDDAHDLKLEEVNALRPLFDDLQTQYDYLLSLAAQNDNAGDPKMEALYEATRLELQEQFRPAWMDTPKMAYDTKLTTAAELLDSISHNNNSGNATLSAELLDMQEILEEALEDAQRSINEIVASALQFEADLIKINKPLILEHIHKSLFKLFGVAARISRAAYCTYTSIPELNTSLHTAYGGVDCYTYTTALIGRVQNETVQAVLTIKQNVLKLVKAYENVAKKRSLVGMVVSLMLNVIKITRSIHDAVAAATGALNSARYELPAAAAASASCGSSFVNGIPQIVESVRNLTTCVQFVDNDTPVYEFLLPEDAREPRIIR